MKNDILVGALLFAGLLLFDLQNILAIFKPIWKEYDINEDEPPSRNFVIVVPIYGKPSYLQNILYLNRYPKSNVLIAINADTNEMRSFANLLRQRGYQVAEICEQRKLAPATLIKAAIKHIDESAEWVIRLDGDSYTDKDIGYAVNVAEKYGADIASVKILPSRRKTLAECLQGVEYDIAMRGRIIRPWLTSGACFIARKKSLVKISAHHTQWFYGEDVEVGFIAKYLGMKAIHINFVCYTSVPETWKDLFKQRKGWWAGYIRTCVVNFDKLAFRFPFQFLYGTGMVILLGFFKWHDLLNAKHLLWVPTIFLVYSIGTMLANWNLRSIYMIPLAPFALAQALCIPFFGIPTYLNLVMRYKISGRWKVGPSIVLKRYWGQKVKKRNNQ